MMKKKAGFKHPPKKNQFKPGQSGNPRGRPRGSRNFKTDLLEELYSKIVVTQEGRRRTITRQQALLKQLMVDALRGQPKARHDVITLIMTYDKDIEQELQEDHTSEANRMILERSLARLGYVKKGKANG